ncbi:MAG TPA: transposase [Methylomirabilota bacterium]|nr:transposase [Methylomirabilota bacterium]
MLHGVIRERLDEFLPAAADRADGAGLPEFIARDFRKFLTCGVLAHGFARVPCVRCAFEHLLPFSAVQRFGGGLNLNVHFHTLALDGVFVRSPAGRLAFHPACGPSDAEVAKVLGTGRADPLAEASFALAGIVGASVQARVALGARAGAPVRRVGDGVRQARGGAGGPRHAHLEGFDLHANVWVGAHDRARLEQVCRYVLRPPLAEDRLRLLGDGRVRLELKRPWSDGTTYLLFEPVEFLEKLAALTPRPEINLVLYHGVLAPGARWRPEVVAYRRAESDGATGPSAAAGRAGPGGWGGERPRYWTWAALMRRAFDLDVLRCPRCAGRMQLIATIDDPAVIQKILARLGLPGTREDPRPPLPLTAAGAEQPTLPGVTV